MPSVVDSLTPLIAPQLAAVESLFTAELRSDLPPVNALCTHVSRFRGKMLRPILVLLSHRAATPSTTPSLSESMEGNPLSTKDSSGHWTLDTGHSSPSPAVVLATVVEMVHMATLVHDDILDSAEVRRKGATINHLHGNEAAVLLGDFLISHAYHLASSLGSQTFARLIAHTTNVVCEGELTQNFNRNNWKLTEATYFDIIYRKTAILTETCCRLGALVASPDHPPTIAALAAFGKNVGLAFQIVDDILDIVGLTKTVGKSLGSDIEKGKLTLPMIHFLHHAAPQHRALLQDLLQSKDLDRVARVRHLLAPSDSIAYARNAAESLIADALAALAPLPDSDAKDALTHLAHFVTARDN